MAGLILEALFDTTYEGPATPLPNPHRRIRLPNGELRWVEVHVEASPCVDFRFDMVALQDVTAHERNQRRLQYGEENLRKITDHISAAVLIQRKEEILYVNRAMENLTGYAWDELLILDPKVLVAEADLARIAELTHLLLEGAPAEPLEFTLRTRRGETRRIELQSTTLEFKGRAAVFHTLFDVTERNRAEQGQDEARRDLRRILDSGPVPTFVINQHHVVTHWNRACEQVTGIAAEKIIGTQDQWCGFYPAKRPVLADLIVDGNIASGLETYYAGRYRRSAVIEGAYEAEGFFPQCGQDGRWLYFTAVALRNSDGELIGAIETLQDVTERKLAEAALHELLGGLESKVEERTAELVRAKAELEEDVRCRRTIEQELRTRNAELEALNLRLSEAQQQLLQQEKLASIGQLAAGVAHEINNPIGYVQSNLGSLNTYIDDIFKLLEASEAAQDASKKADFKALKERMDLAWLKEDTLALMAESREGVGRVKKIVQDLRDFSRLDRDQEWQPADLHQGIDSTLNIVANEIKYSAEVVKRYGVLPEVECLPSQLNQVFMNLLVNAAHAMEGTPGTITITTGTEASEVWIEFSDTGKGINPENLKRIFDPFFTTKPVGKGTGLGLSISYGIVQKHKGRIEVSSTPGLGTRFRITLPVRHPDEE